MNRIEIAVDVTKIDKSHLFKGEKGIFLQLVLIPTPNNQYGNDFMVKQNIPSQFLPEGTRAPIIGNAAFHNPKESEIPF